MSPDARLPWLGHGIDLVEVERLHEVMQRNAAFEERVFTEAERAYCRSKAAPRIHFAGRFAVKEAALKALGLGLGAVGISQVLRDVEVEGGDGPPRVLLHGKPLDTATRLGVGRISVSITHTADHAVASVVMLGDGPGREEEVVE
jgi:holo-[acyl-carrier protein] synthase